MNPSTLLKPATVLGVALAACLPLQAGAQSAPPDGTWRYGASIYGFLPTIGGHSSLPSEGGTSVDVDASKIIDKLKMTFMGAFDAHNGRWGVFTDVLYLNLGEDKQQTRDFSIGNVGLPVGTSANIDWDLKGVIWTLAGQYRVVSQPAITLDVLGGARLFSLKQRIRYDITGDIGSLPPSGRSGESEVDKSNWDAIVGVKGRYAINDRWSVPFYGDVGTGESSITRQVAAGISYRYSWGELSGMYRYLGYRMKSGEVMEKISFYGPMIGATFRW